MNERPMKSCRDFDSLVTPYVDGEATPDECAAIEAHLSACPPCRRRADAEAGARMVVRRCRDSLRESAPASLHAACRTLASQMTAAEGPGSAQPAWLDATARADATSLSGIGPGTAAGVGTATAAGIGSGHAAGAGAGVASGIAAVAPDAPPAPPRSANAAPRTWRVWLPLAATVLLAIAGVVAFGLVSERSTALAQQVVTDHLRCVKLTLGKPPADRIQMAERWQKSRGWFIALPASSPNDDVEFIALRRCLHGGGEMAHALYRHQGRLVSLFIFPDDGRWGAKREIMGQRATIWSQHGRTYAVVDDGSPADVERLVAFFARAAE